MRQLCCRNGYACVIGCSPGPCARSMLRLVSHTSEAAAGAKMEHVRVLSAPPLTHVPPVARRSSFVLALRRAGNGGSGWGGGGRSGGGGGGGGGGGDGERKEEGGFDWTVAAVAALVGPPYLQPTTAEAKTTPKPRGKQSSKQEEFSTDALIDAIKGPVGKNMGISFLAGLCSAALFKAVARGAAVAFGLVFCSIQLLAMAGIVQVDWVKAGKMVERFTDLNSDGKFDNEDVKLLVSRATGVLGDGLPSVGGFIAGLHTGLSFF